MKLHKKKELNSDNFVQAITSCFKNELFPEKTGSYVIKKYVELQDNICVMLNLVTYKNDKYDNYVNVHVSILSDYSEELKTYLVTLAKYSICFDMNNNTHTCVSTFISGNLQNKHIDLLNEWSTNSKI